MVGDGAREALIFARRRATAEWAREPRDPESAAVAEIRDRIKTEPDPRSLSTIYTTAACRRLLGPKDLCIPLFRPQIIFFSVQWNFWGERVNDASIPTSWSGGLFSFMKSSNNNNNNKEPNSMLNIPFENLQTKISVL